ncbi:ATV_HP_G0025400.mRNA.1.CDS.1 [Saccharomyces cerevisiae]|nr:ATV_HP_G0025400.mRNA.1.CDS.1 [Saccharomyces cerevisiae]CAI6961012.1 ATV_HP_G0025400.mRNA.1.CDS.1 [Saccharomyces cerevisiae]
MSSLVMNEDSRVLSSDQSRWRHSQCPSPPFGTGHHQEHRQQQLWDRSIGSIQGALQATQPKTPKNVTASAAAAINTFIHDQMHRWQGPLTTSAQCRRFGGHWAGGHDPSGHVFLATLMCMFLLGELRVFGRRALALTVR